MRTQILQADLERARESHAKIKKDTTERERFLSKVQAVWNERKRMATELEATVRWILTIVYMNSGSAGVGDGGRGGRGGGRTDSWRFDRARGVWWAEKRDVVGNRC